MFIQPWHWQTCTDVYFHIPTYFRENKSRHCCREWKEPLLMACGTFLLELNASSQGWRNVTEATFIRRYCKALICLILTRASYNTELLCVLGHNLRQVQYDFNLWFVIKQQSHSYCLIIDYSYKSLLKKSKILLHYVFICKFEDNVLIKYLNKSLTIFLTIKLIKLIKVSLQDFLVWSTRFWRFYLMVFFIA